MSNVTDSKPLRELIAEAKAEVTEEIEESKDEEEEDDHEGQLVRVLQKTKTFFRYNLVIIIVFNLNNLFGQ